MTSLLLVGLGETNEAVARVARTLGHTVVIVDDRPGHASRTRAATLEIDLVEAPDTTTLEDRVRAADVVVPAPGVPWTHPVRAFADRAGVAVWSEFELAARWGLHVPVVAVTGTNGKTTVTAMVTEMLVEAGIAAVPAGNGQPIALVEAVAMTSGVVVVEAPSFRLADTESFRPDVAVWLNVDEDHLDWHPSMEHYVASKARIWVNQREEDVAVANADDPVVRAAAEEAPGRVELFGLSPDAQWSLDGDVLRTPGGEVVVSAGELRRALPHDMSNALAAVAAASAAGAPLDPCRAVLRRYVTLPHRVELVGEAGGVRFFDDSKATTPASVAAAVSGFDSVVLIAGGRNKGLHFDRLRALAPRIRCVVAIGESAGEITAAFEGVRPVRVAASMDEAVDVAIAVARAGDTVLLSPGAASFDWYGSYGERGDDFARAVRERVGP